MEKKSTPNSKSFISRLLSPFRSMGCTREPKVKEDMTPPVDLPKEDKVVEENNSGVNNNVTEAVKKEVNESGMTKEVDSELKEPKYDESSSGQEKKTVEPLVSDIQEDKKSESGETSEILVKGQ